MGASKRYKGKDCAYCGSPKCSSTNDHVVPRSFFLDAERGPSLELPQVPSCVRCNNEKSALENYVGAVLLIGSNHPEGKRYRQEKIAPRLRRNRKFWNEAGLDEPPRWVPVNGILQPLHVVKVDPKKIELLLQMIVRGLYCHHYGKPLAREIRPDVNMFRPEAEAAMWANVCSFFPADVQRFSRDLGHGTFRYSCVQSPANDSFTAWVISLHGGIRLRGEDGSADHWWCMTWPTPDALAAECPEAIGAMF